MVTLTIGDLPDEVHRALGARAARHGRSTEEEVRAILEEAVTPTMTLRVKHAVTSKVEPKERVTLGALLAAINKEVGLSDEDFAEFDQALRELRAPVHGMKADLESKLGALAEARGYTICEYINKVLREHVETDSA